MHAKLKICQPEDGSLISDVVGFWRKAGAQGRWFDKDDGFDRRFREAFLSLHMDVAARRHDHWMASAEGALALLIMTDQFPRNAFRGTGQMYATDLLARHYARQARDAGHMDHVEPALQLFFCLPFAHSEDIADQDVSVRLNAGLGEPWVSHAQGHRDIIRRFGRFPHRNPMLGRETTPEEAAFLREGGFRG
ncbi:uncharacterized protein (DUF924 family) [Mesorhizobium soli]|uniref:DUF924 family protein n=1 Tax=Pseudaminobacter soli (ex Li et al. 2025) TaxID=1295366 RepID=UPI00247480EB|nr:DUF924 family protein [Mesorhizobium soli]MDH6230766.1 uncharacterized protein (DUF924 family) [Mesorhizobium soli]